MNENGNRTEASSKLLITPASPPNKQIFSSSSCNTRDAMPPDTKNDVIINQPQHFNHARVDALQCNGFTDSIVVTSSAPLSGLNEREPVLQTTNNSMLYQIIAKDVKHPRNNKMVEKNIDSRTTVVKKAPYGAVHITYKNMINTTPSRSGAPIPILPKPSPNQQQHNQQQQHQNYKSIDNKCLTSSSSLVNNFLYTQKGITTAYKSPCQHSTSLSIRLPEPPSVPLSVPQSSSIIQNNDELTYTTNNLPNDQHSTNENNFTSPTTTLECMESSSNDIQAATNPFTNLDIDLSCLNTDGFDVSNDFFMSNQQTSGIMDSGDTTLLSTSAETPFAAYVNSTIGDTISSTYQSAVISDVSNLQQELATNIRGEFLQSQHCDNMIDSLTPTGEQPCREDVAEVQLVDITDVSPETTTCSGGNKIILIGSWNAKDARYQCQFGVYVVQAELIQIGVLRCYSPIHKPGLVKLSVLRNDVVISKETDFTFTSDCNQEKNIHEEWLSITDKSLTRLLVERVWFISEMIGEVDRTMTSNEILNAGEEKIEGVLLEACKKLMNMPVDFDFDYNIENTMTVLHLASALGYLKLIQLLMNWAEANPNKIIIAEANPRCFDQFSLLPIMWSSAKGHFNTTCVLHQWAEDTLELKDQCGCNVLNLAKECGHGPLVEYLSRLLKKSAVLINRDEQSVMHNQSSISNTSSVGQQKNSDVIDSSPKTLGRTLAYIQSMLNVQDDRSQSENEAGEICMEGDDDDIVEMFDATQFPSSSMSPGSASQTSLQSPFDRQIRETAEFCEFFYKAKRIEKDFAELTLTDEEQEELYNAANVIQTAYKAYKERSKLRDQEFSSATLIQSYYRRYKQYAAFKKMQKGAVLIQNSYRAHREKSKKKSEAASLIQTYYRRYRQRKDGESEHQSVQEKNKQTQQANRKNNRYLQQSTNRFSRDLTDEFHFDASGNT